jgi:hypothetical protein
MEQRLGHDFSRVRVHTDAGAAAAARAVSADAFALGSDLYFAPGRYAPGTADGRRLLAHELAHTVQQPDTPASTGGVPLDPGPAQEREAERVARLVESGRPGSAVDLRAGTGGPPALRRVIAVDDPAGLPAGATPGETKQKIVNDYVAVLCPSFAASAGRVAPVAAGFCPGGTAASAAPAACACLCSMHGLADTWTIVVDDNDWPHTDDTTKTVTVHSPFSGVAFGAWAAGPPPHRTSEPNWLVLGHELCGHAELMSRGVHPTGPAPTHGGRPSHDVTVGVENTIAAEHGIPAAGLRGLFADPHHGESLARVTVARFGVGSASVSTLPAAERRQLDIAEAFINSAPVKMDIEGHADQVGPAASNQILSLQRANSVKAELVRRGINPARFLSTQGRGEAECTAPGDQPSCRKVNIFMFIMEGGSVTHP